MPTLLYRYILGDLFRVVLVTTVVLVSVIAFGAAIRPLADDQILAPLQVAKYIGLAMVPMLQFALPFAAGFAATMAFHRMASDNEMVAIAVGGVSYPRILVPVLVLGVLLSGIMVGLTQWVIPKFWGLMEETITKDVTDIFQSRIDSGQPFTLGDMQIYADELIPQDHPPDTGAQSRLVLLGVAAAVLDEDKRIVTDVTASRAAIDIYRRQHQTYLKLILTDTVAFNRETSELYRTAKVEPDAVVIPSILYSKARAMTRNQLVALRTDPEGYATIYNHKIQLADLLREHDIWTAFSDRLRSDGVLTLRDITRSGHSYRIQADRIDQGEFLREGSAPIVITQREQGRAVRRFTSSHAVLFSLPSDGLDDGGFELRLADVEVTELGGDQRSNRRKEVVLNVQSAAEMPVRRLQMEPVEVVLAQARSVTGRNRRMAQLIARLDSRMERLQWEVSARLQKRYALSATALLLIALGSILAIWLRRSQPLTIYLLAFLPSILDLILISGGEQMMRDGRIAVGGTVMWMGNGTMVLLTLAAFSQLRRH